MSRYMKLEREIRVATPTKTVYVDSTERLAEELEGIFKSLHLMGRRYHVLRVGDYVVARIPELEIDFHPPHHAYFKSLKGNVQFHREVPTLREVVAGEEVLTFRFENPREEYVIYPATGTIVVSKCPPLPAAAPREALPW